MAQWGQQHVILKAKRSKPREDTDLTFLHGEVTRKSFPSVDQFLEMVRSYITSTLGFTDESQFTKLSNYDLIERLYTPNKDAASVILSGDTKQALDLNSSPVRIAAMQSLWYLINQDEYLFLQFFSVQNFLPKIYGTCGHLYAMEYAPTMTVLNPGLGEMFFKSSWNERALIAVQILDLLLLLDTGFPHPVHLCDIKGENFGINTNEHIVPIDMDSVFLRPELEKMMGDDCEKHSDCHFFDCRGRCKLAAENYAKTDSSEKKGTCHKKVYNSNLQVSCLRI